mmetsp:Transcript_38858/g.121412  ORF Transcript_38858/g.121412 Transcript_38858/m.121412 type:complete len:262 (+) Transcript_38858:51-836(+)
MLCWPYRASDGLLLVQGFSPLLPAVVGLPCPFPGWTWFVFVATRVCIVSCSLAALVVGRCGLDALRTFLVGVILASGCVVTWLVSRCWTEAPLLWGLCAAVAIAVHLPVSRVFFPSYVVRLAVFMVLLNVCGFLEGRWSGASAHESATTFREGWRAPTGEATSHPMAVPLAIVAGQLAVGSPALARRLRSLWAQAGRPQPDPISLGVLPVGYPADAWPEPDGGGTSEDGGTLISFPNTLEAVAPSSVDDSLAVSTSEDEGS